MAGEDLFRQRYADVFHDTDEYQSAAKRAAIDAERQRTAFQQQLAQGPTGQHAVDVLQQGLSQQGNSAGEVTLRGLDKYQDSRANDYMDTARTRRAQQALTMPVSVADSTRYKVGLLNPDFSNDQPWSRVNIRGVGPLAVETAKGRADNWTLDDDVQAEYDARGRLSPRTQDALQERDTAERTDLRGQAADRAATSKRAKSDLLRREMVLRQALPDLAAGANAMMPGQRSVYDLLTPTEKADILRLPPEQQRARLANHPLRKLAGKPRPVVGVGDFLGDAQKRGQGLPTAELVSDDDGE